MNTFGKDTLWWSLLFGVLLVLIGLDISFKFIKRSLIAYGFWTWPPWRERDADDNCENWDRQLWQELEQDPVVREHLRQTLQDEKDGVVGGGGRADVEETI